MIALQHGGKLNVETNIDTMPLGANDPVWVLRYNGAVARAGTLSVVWSFADAGSGAPFAYAEGPANSAPWFDLLPDHRPACANA